MKNILNIVGVLSLFSCHGILGAAVPHTDAPPGSSPESAREKIAFYARPSNYAIPSTWKSIPYVATVFDSALYGAVLLGGAYAGRDGLKSLASSIRNSPTLARVWNVSGVSVAHGADVVADTVAAYPFRSVAGTAAVAGSAGGLVGYLWKKPQEARLPMPVTTTTRGVLEDIARQVIDFAYMEGATKQTAHTRLKAQLQNAASETMPAEVITDMLERVKKLGADKRFLLTQTVNAYRALQTRDISENDAIQAVLRAAEGKEKIDLGAQIAPLAEIARTHEDVAAAIREKDEALARKREGEAALRKVVDHMTGLVLGDKAEARRRELYGQSLDAQATAVNAGATTLAQILEIVDKERRALTAENEAYDTAAKKVKKPDDWKTQTATAVETAGTGARGLAARSAYSILLEQQRSRRGSASSTSSAGGRETPRLM